MTLEQYIVNPLGKNNAVLNSITRETLRKEYRTKLDTIMVRESGKVEYKLFYDKAKNRYWAYIKVPSEVVKKFYYDVILVFSPNSKTGSSNNIFDYDFRAYSNDPAFVFNFAYVFYKNDLFVNELQKKMSKRAIKEEAKEKNPYNLVGYVKSLYFGYLIMKDRGLNNLTKFKAEAKGLDLPYIMDNVEDADEKVRKRQEEGAKLEKHKRSAPESKNEEEKKSIPGFLINKVTNTLGLSKTSTTKKITPTKTSSTTFVKTSKTSKKIK